MIISYNPWGSRRPPGELGPDSTHLGSYPPAEPPRLRPNPHGNATPSRTPLGRISRCHGESDFLNNYIDLYN